MQENNNAVVSGTGKASDNIRKELKRRIILLCITTAAVLAVVPIATIAWFASNDKVMAEGIKVRASDDKGFDLSTPGEEMTREDLTQYLDDSSSVKWNLSEQSNLMNLGSGEQSVGVSPGTSGSLTFFIEPKTDGPLTIDCTLDIIPKMKETSDSAELAAQKKEEVTKLLRGHLLFACRYKPGADAEENRTLLDISNGGFKIVVPDAKTGEENKISVTLDWFWPYTLKDARNHSVFGTDIQNLLDDKNNAQYFYYGLTWEESTIPEYSILNNSYNEADQIIGDRVRAVVLELNANRAS
ncbi:MAG: hypothetical protein Q4D40_04440 [Eubacteriales bacterium]|nr:hypothetical protein [Eubacteriales bacterium]